jgi:predicted O-methyltransferase YrrM
MIPQPEPKSFRMPQTLLISDERFDSVENVLGVSRTSFSASVQFARAVVRMVVLGGRRSILEFGAGVSSLAEARALEIVGGGCLTSLDHDTFYCQSAWQQVASIASVDSRLIDAPLRLRLTRAGLMYCYDAVRDAVSARAPYDLVVADAPPNAFGRDATLWHAYRYLAPGALILLDDAGRRREKAVLQHWVRQYPGLVLLEHDLSFGAHGVALLQYDGSGTCITDARAVIDTIRERWRSRAKVAVASARGEQRGVVQ